MVKINEGSYLLDTVSYKHSLVESIKCIKELITSCKVCAIVERPSIVEVYIANERIELAAGIGSLICEDCSSNDMHCDKELLIRITRPVWVDARIVSRGNLECMIYGAKASEADDIKLKLEEIVGTSIRISINEEIPHPIMTNGLILSSMLKELYKEEVPEGGKCGRLETKYPLHPISFIGRFKEHICVNKLFLLHHPLIRRLTYDLLSLNNYPLVQLYRSLGEVLLVNYPLDEENMLLRLALLIGVLYTCAK
ncbi:MAG: hypothetical protein ABWW69_04695 [Pyrodictiaceae archaeon]